MTRLCAKLGSLHAVLTPHGLYSFRRNFIPFWPSLHSSFLIHTQRKTVSLAKKLWRLHKDYDLIKCWLAHTKLLILVQTVLSLERIAASAKIEWSWQSHKGSVTTFPEQKRPLGNFKYLRYTMQNLHWKLGQQTPSAGTLLAYLETMV